MMFERPTRSFKLPGWLGWMVVTLAFLLTCIALILTPFVLVAMLVISSVRSLFGAQPRRTKFATDAEQLIACPLCGLCVTAIPATGVCPECGSAYDLHGEGSHSPPPIANLPPPFSNPPDVNRG
ncbi:MAG: hypothetical protein AABZ53_05590 [Planctomycetota bacterium]